jgi:hypothetical protein
LIVAAYREELGGITRINAEDDRAQGLLERVSKWGERFADIGADDAAALVGQDDESRGVLLLATQYLENAQVLTGSTQQLLLRKLKAASR